jgi:hypothetical protein
MCCHDICFVFYYVFSLYVLSIYTFCHNRFCLFICFVNTVYDLSLYTFSHYMFCLFIRFVTESPLKLKVFSFHFSLNFTKIRAWVFFRSRHCLRAIFPFLPWVWPCFHAFQRFIRKGGESILDY